MKVISKDFGLNKIEKICVKDGAYFLTEEEIRNKFPVGCVVKFEHMIYSCSLEIGTKGMVIGYVTNNTPYAKQYGELYVDIKWTDDTLQMSGGYYHAMFERVD